MSATASSDVPDPNDNNVIDVYNALPPEKKAELLEAFQKVMYHRARQWDCELTMESILDADVDMDVPGFATMLDTPVSWENVQATLGEHELLLAIGADGAVDEGQSE